MEEWQLVAERQAGLLSRRQLRAAGVSRHLVRNQVQARRWVPVTPRVLATVTGRLTWTQQAWAAVLHAGPRAALAGLTALRMQGLQRWDRATIEVLVPADLKVPAVGGVRFLRTRRDLERLRLAGAQGHLVAVEPAGLLAASRATTPREGCGLLAALVQQRLTTPARLSAALEALQPLPRAALLGSVLGDIAGGAMSASEADLRTVCRRFGLRQPTRQRRRTDRGGRVRWTDAEWELGDGRVVILEVDGAFHTEVEQWGSDLARQRALTGFDRIVLRCTSIELRTTPADVVRDLAAVGVVGPSVRQSAR